MPLKQKRFRNKNRAACSDARSEEHTSELQSQSNLVCRLLLEKKKYVTDWFRVVPYIDTDSDLLDTLARDLRSLSAFVAATILIGSTACDTFLRLTTAYSTPCI